jgi:sugar lactone lactonase YvrE
MKPYKSFTSAMFICGSIAVLLTSCSKSGAVKPNKNPELANIPGHTYTLAGSGTLGLLDGLRIEANFSNPNGVAVDAASNLYVADQGNNVIRKITPAGAVSTFAGSGMAGSADGAGTSASFNSPIGIAIDATGNVFVADFGNNLIRKITPGGDVSTLAGSGAIGFDDGKGALATFNGPAGIAIDHSGNVYVADNHSLIREITPDQTVTTIAGAIHNSPGFANGTGLEANFRLPEGLAIDAAGNIYVADYSNNMIRKISPQRVVTTLAGQLTAGLGNGTAETATFNGPIGVAVDAAGNVYVNDTGNNLIRKITTSGMVSTFAGTGAKGVNNGENLQATFNDLHGIAVDANGNVYVGDEQNARIRKIIPAK